MKRVAGVFLLIGFTAFLACAHPAAGPQQGHSQFEIDIPPGWQRHSTKKFFLIYKKDPLRQYILVQERPLGLPFEFSNKRLQAGMPSSEVATVVVDELTADKQLFNLAVIEKTPARIQGNEGCRIVFSYGLGDGSNYKTLYYGFIRGESYFSLRFNVSAEKDFEEELQAFNEVIGSLRFPSSADPA